MREDWESELHDAGEDPSLVPDMTLVVGIKTAESCILASDSKEVYESGIADGKARKLYQCGTNCVVGIAGQGEIAVNILKGCGFVGNDGEVNPRQRAEDIGNAFRAYTLGRRDIADWCTPWARVSDVNWLRGPDASALVSGVGCDGPALFTFDRKSGYACLDSGSYSVIGAKSEVARSILNAFLPKDATPSPELAKFLCSLSVVVTSQIWPHLVDDDIRMYEVFGAKVERVGIEPYRARAREIMSGLVESIRLATGQH
jgi:hypothetical protein